MDITTIKEEVVEWKKESIAEEEVDSKSKILRLDSEDVPSIVDSISLAYINNFQPVYKRYYEAYYCTKFTTTNENLDTCIRVHSNKVSVIYLSDKHSIFRKNQKIKELKFQVSNKVNRLQNTMSGKGKKGAQLLTPDAVLCHIHTEDGTSYAVPAGIYGKLLEINSEIVDDPNLLIRDNLADGFVAIILQDLKKFEDNMKSLQTQEEYFAT